MKITPRPFPRSEAEKLVDFLSFFEENNTFDIQINETVEMPTYGIYDAAFSSTLKTFIDQYNSSFVSVYLDNRGDWGIVDNKDKIIANPELIETLNLLELRMFFAHLTYVGYEGKDKLHSYILNSTLIVKMLSRLSELMCEIAIVTQENEVWLDKLIAWADKKGIEDYYTRPKTLDIIWGGLPRDKELLLNSYTLEIGWNKLKELPKEIGNLTNLIEIRAWCSNLKKIPKEIGNLINLRELSLDDNKIKELPKEISELKNLLVLSMGSNPLKKLPEEIGNLKKLQVLELSKSPIQNFPRELCNLSELRTLSIEECKYINCIPKEIGQLHNQIDFPDARIGWSQT